jgi:predicted peroxiredoxin
MWLTGDSVWFAVAGREPTTSLPGSPALADLRDIVLAGGDLLVCTQCANRRGISSSDLVVGARIAGSSSFVEEILSPDTQAIVY